MQEPSRPARAPAQPTPSLQLLSTDFDGTLHTEHEDPPVPVALQGLIGGLQARGVKWIINTGRDLASLMEALTRARVSIQPDYIVAVEREIYRHDRSCYVPVTGWNNNCDRDHRRLFEVIQADLPAITRWVGERFRTTIYSDAYSPFCIAAQDNDEADAIVAHVTKHFRHVPELIVMRNDVYARFSHAAYNKGTALAEIARQLGIGRDQTLAAGDHFNDLPMLSLDYARWLIAPMNAIEPVKAAVRRQNGYVSHQNCGHGVARGLEHFLEQARG